MDAFRLQVRKLVVCTAHLSEHDLEAHKRDCGCPRRSRERGANDCYATTHCRLKEERYHRRLSEQEKFIQSSDPVDILSEALNGLENCSSILFTDDPGESESEKASRRPGGLTKLENEIGINLAWHFTRREPDTSKTTGSADFFKAALKIVLLAAARSNRTMNDISISVGKEDARRIRPSFLRFPEYERLFRERLRGLNSLTMYLDSWTFDDVDAVTPDDAATPNDANQPILDTAQDIINFLNIWPNLSVLSIFLDEIDCRLLRPEFASSLHLPNLVELRLDAMDITWNELNTILRKHGALQRLVLCEYNFQDFNVTDLRKATLGRENLQIQVIALEGLREARLF